VNEHISSSEIVYRTDLEDVDWDWLRRDLIDDDFHNGRTTEQLRMSFENSSHVAMAFADDRCIGTARALSDGVGNGYVIDVWTQSSHREHGVSSEMMSLLMRAMPGQHLYLQTDTAVGFYEKLGFKSQPQGMSIVVGQYLANPTRR
jgi:ribosomal protein S18 acetylase RimI-like enzyme